ncbi:type I restriction enzyme HsdR N-terminal domain-containing protein [Geothermobacter hydrogeniphilus]|uniref:Uncharacterized protein n=1 Tax=Geothermobacter hydrogeniphilus TaxID=1969733 RepID=A0A1X0XSQ6_9BACT|nr:type I restriction enzyme HsdR N-terminal domain-containing protein [Geothermobacter hydrogeniphilus]ORJ55887.1 hypothetical protein B5V00_14605 [Geothermobacter hydrogeniphilus]
MELTEQSFRDRLSYLSRAKIEKDEEWNDIVRRLKEKGVEYCIVLPLFEVVLGFDPLKDVKMEQGSDEYSNQRFDFVITPQENNHYSLIIEAKSLLETNLKKHEEQITKYMRDNQEYPWGILTNGFEWHFFLSKKYIEFKFNDDRPLDNYKSNKIFNVLSLSLSDENFIEIMQGMRKGDLGTFWHNMAKYTYATIAGGRGKRPNIHNNRSINEYISEQIKEAVEIKTGEYWDLIQSGKMNKGDKVFCKNNFIDLTFELDSGGRLILKPKRANTHDFAEFIKHCSNAVELLTAWQGSTNTFTDRSQVVKALTGGKKFTKTLKNMFPFTPSP